MLENIKNFFRKEADISGVRTPQPWLKRALGGAETYSGVDVTAENSLGVSAVCACVRLLSESVASLPLFTLERTEKSKVKATTHPTYRCLHTAPNDFQTSYTWRQQAMSHVLLYGNSYSVIERDDAGNVVKLWPLPATEVTVKVNGGRITYERYHGGTKTVYEFADVLHIKGPSLDGVTGQSIISMARQGIGLAAAQDQFGASLFKNKARPGMCIKGMFNKAQREQLLESVGDQGVIGHLNAGKILILPSTLDIVPLGFSSEDSQWIESRQFSIQEVARWFRVSPTMIGDLSRSTYSNSEQEQLSFMAHSLRPWLVNIESEINAKLFRADGPHFAEFEMSAMQRADQATRYESYSKGLASGFLTVADVRRWENLPELPGTDELLRPLNMGPANAPAGVS